MKNVKWLFIPNGDACQDDLRKIAQLKDQHWQYGIKSQVEWMKSNLIPQDVHLLGVSEESGELLAYLSITSLEVRIDNKIIDTEFVGLGNVCVSKEIEHSGYGSALVTEANRYISNKGMEGILLCKSSLLSFYKRCDWQNVNYIETYVAGRRYDKKIMCFPGRIPLNEHVINVNRNF